MERLISLLGLFAMVAIAWRMSSHKRQVNLRIVIVGLLLQVILAVLILKTIPGQLAFRKAGDFCNGVLPTVSWVSS